MENPFETNKPMRSNFLTVLCILTFIGSGWSVLSNLMGLLTTGIQNMTAEMSQFSSNGNMGSSFLTAFTSSAMELMQVAALHATSINLWGLLLSAGSLFGAILMFRLKRTGFYLYVVAQIIQLFVLPMYAGFSIAVLVGVLFSAFFTLLFIILYAVNVRQLK